MKNFKLVSLLCVTFFSSTLSVHPQEPNVRRPASIGAMSSEREQDGLNGSVRRVRVEIAKIEVKDGKPVEGPRVVRGITTYDVEGRRIDTVAYPGENSTLIGKQQYRYDDKGNIIEMVVRGDDGSILGKETYQYEFDELGNWKKMITSVAVYENGQLGFEPMEVTYRTITYFYSQAIDKLAAGANAPSPSRTTSNRSVPKKEDTAKPKAPVVTQERAAGIPVSGNATNPVTTETVKKNPAQPLPTPVATPESPNETSSRTTTNSMTPEAVKNNPAQPVPTPVAISESPNETSRTPANPITSETVKNNPGQPVAPPVKPLETPNTSNRTSNSPVTTPAPRKSSEDATSFYERGLSYLKSGKNGEAVEALKQAVFLNPEDALAYAKLGLAYSALGQHKEAIAAFKLALGIKPEVVDPEANYRLAEAYLATGKNSEALKAYKQALYAKRAEVVDSSSNQSQRFPSLADLYFGLGLAYYNMESFSDAIRELKQATKLGPGSADAHYGLALAYIGIGDRGGAQKEERILRPLNAGLADNVAAALSNVLPKGVTRVAPREDRRTRP